MTRELHRIAVRVAADEVEMMRARLLDVAPAGFEEVELGEEIELAVYADAEAADTVRSALPGARVSLVAAGWEDAWQAFHRPVIVGGLWLGPPWEEWPSNVPAVVIDPGRAFGTGAHATTQLCIELLAGLEPGALLDVGCGSGVVTIAAARLGFGPLCAVDVDPVAVEVTEANAAANGVAVRVCVVDAVRDELPPCDVAVANIALNEVDTLLARIDAGTVVTSGYLDVERPVSSGWTHCRRLELDGWAADQFRRATV